MIYGAMTIGGKLIEFLSQYLFVGFPTAHQQGNDIRGMTSCN